MKKMFVLWICVLGCSSDSNPPLVINQDVDTGRFDMSDVAKPVPDSGPDAQSETSSDVGDEQQAKLAALRTAIQADLDRNLATAASVSIWNNDSIEWVGGFGTVPETENAPDEETLFVIGSDTKKLTALIALRLMERDDEFNLMTTIEDVFPMAPFVRAPEYHTASVHELLTHQGGIVDRLGPLTSSTNDAALNDYMFTQIAQTAYALAPPGEFYNYSNTNFSMVGLLCEGVANRPWADLAQSELIEPLQLERTFARKDDVDSNRAIGVNRNQLGRPEVVSFDETTEDAFARPAGFIWSTPTDQMKIARVLVDGDPSYLDELSIGAVSTNHVPMWPDIPGGYGYGLIVNDTLRIGENVYSTRTWSHGGNTLTHTSTFFVLPDQRFAISILSNGLGDNFSNSVATAIQNFAELPTPGPVQNPQVDPAVVASLPAEYNDPNNVGRMNVTAVDGQLELEFLDIADLVYERQLIPFTSRIWFLDLGDSTIDLRFVSTERADYIVNRQFVGAVGADPNSIRVWTGAEGRPRSSPEFGPTPRDFLH